MLWCMSHDAKAYDTQHCTASMAHGTPCDIPGSSDLEDGTDIGTCAGCGAYGKVGRVHVRDGEECGEIV